MWTRLMICAAVMFILGSGSLSVYAADACQVTLVGAGQLEPPAQHGVEALEQALTSQGCVVTLSLIHI